MRRRYIWSKKQKKLVLKAEGETRRNMHYIHSFIPFSPTSDPSVVFSSYNDIKEYEKKTGLQWLADHDEKDLRGPTQEQIAQERHNDIHTLARELCNANHNFPDFNLERLSEAYLNDEL